MNICVWDNSYFKRIVEEFGNVLQPKKRKGELTSDEASSLLSS
jgi:hypothetical protein